jgi:archaeal flagellar protein FlaJ
VPKIEKKEKQLVAAVSAALGVSIAVVAILSISVLHSKMPFDWDQMIVIGLMVAVFPPSVIELMDLRWEHGIDKNIPRLLREIAESGKTGLTLTRAIEVSAERDYGPLTKELNQLVAQLSWGSSIEEAFHAFASRARTKLAQRTSDLIVEVARSGGDTQEVMEQVNKHIGELQSIDRERYSQMRPYAAVVYIAFGVFLFTDILLIKSFFTQIVELQAKVMATSGGGGGVFAGAGSVDVGFLKKVLYHAVIIQAVFGGLIAGKMSEGRLGAGLKHTLLLLVIAFVTFFLFVWRT